MMSKLFSKIESFMRWCGKLLQPYRPQMAI